MVGTFEISSILDSMDAVKYSWPRSHMMNAKLFCKFNRPKLSCTTFLVHGHMCLTTLTANTISCNSSRTAEIVSHGLHLLSQKGVDLSRAVFHLQADNASKECKNQCILRHLAAQVSLHKLKGAQMSFLTSGHSHEDIDALFALLRSWLQRSPEIWDPKGFQTTLQSFFDQPTARPHEKFNPVTMLSRFRDWKLSIVSCVVFYFYNTVDCFFCVSFVFFWKLLTSNFHLVSIPWSGKSIGPSTPNMLMSKE